MPTLMRTKSSVMPCLARSAALIPECEVVLGLVTTKLATLEAPRELIRRIEEAARYVPLDHLCLSPQCGFSSTVEGNEITKEDQWAKLGLVLKVARDVWGDEAAS